MPKVRVNGFFRSKKPFAEKLGVYQTLARSGGLPP